MIEFVPSKINDRWELVLPDFRERFHADRPWWEVGRVEHCAERMKPGMIVWDIGAEHADFSALYAKWVTMEWRDERGPYGTDVQTSGGVVLIEPSHGYWPCIRQTFNANGLVVPVACFVGFASSKTHTPPRGPKFTEAAEHAGWMGSDGWPLCSVGEVIEDFGFRHLAQQTDSTPETRIDDFARECGYPPDALVMDIEGAEWDALNGLGGLDKLPLVWVSVHPPTMLDWYGKTPADIDTLMMSLGYREHERLRSSGEGEDFYFYEPR